MSSAYGPGTLYCAECGRPSTPDELARFGELLICPACKESYAQKLREGVAPVAARQVVYGGFWIRFVAVLIDSIILFIVGSVVQYALLGSQFSRLSAIQNTTRPEEVLGPMLAAFGLGYLINTLIACTYETFFIARLQATPGKMAMSLRVVRADGSRIGAGHAAGRYFAKMLSGLILCIGYIMAGFDSEKRGLHDMICDTRVIRIQN